VSTIVKPGTILAWYRVLIAEKFDGSRQRKAPDRPRVDEQQEVLVMWIAEENCTQGYDRMAGALTCLGYSISDRTVGNIRPAQLRGAQARCSVMNGAAGS
jgi:putative transposase